MASLQVWIRTLEVFLASWLATISTGKLGAWAYILLALMVLLEGPLATLVGAVAAAAGLMKLPWVFVSAAAGNLTADSLWYSLGYFGKSDWIVKYGKVLRIRAEHVEQFKQQIRENAVRILLIAKLTLSFAVPALISAGMARVPWRRWLGAIVLGEFLWSGCLVLTGYFFSKSLEHIVVGLRIVALVGIVLFALLFSRFTLQMARRWHSNILANGDHSQEA